jgi:hypothetical protein
LIERGYTEKIQSEKFYQAAQQIKAGNKLAAIPILKEIIQENPNDENAWAGLYYCVEKDDQKIYCLEQVLKINPYNKKAQNALNKFKPRNNSWWLWVAGIGVFLCLGLFVIGSFVLNSRILNRTPNSASVLAMDPPTATLEPVIIITDTPLPTATQTLTPTIEITSTPKPTMTSFPTFTPIIIKGSVEHPYSINDYAELPIIPEEFQLRGMTNWGEIGYTLLDVKYGDDAYKLAKRNLDSLGFKEPIDNQEYLAVFGELNFLRYENNTEVKSLYPYWNLTLRYENEGPDIWSENYFEKYAEGYPPIQGSGWVFFLIKKDTKPFLYFQPLLMVEEQYGMRSSGAYYQLLENQ